MLLQVQLHVTYDDEDDDDVCCFCVKGMCTLCV